MRIVRGIAGVGVVMALGCGSGAAEDAGTDGPGSAGDATAGDADGTADDGDGDGTVSDADGTMDGVDGTAGDDDGDPSARPNWHEDIAPLVAANCRGCHAEDGIAFTMASWVETMPYAGLMKLETAAGRMPPWHAVETDECTPPDAFQHDARLSPEEIQLLADWADAGAPEGDPANAVAIPEPPVLELADPSVTVPMGGSITVEAVGTQLDYFHCLSFDPGNDTDVYVDGIQVRPGNSGIAHHVLLYVDEGGQSASWPNGISEDCGGGAGIGGATLVGGWVPGSFPMETPDGVGILLPAGARIVLNMHYHASVIGPETDDSTAVALRWSTTAPEYVSEFYLIGAPGAGDTTTGAFTIPAGASGHEEVVEFQVPQVGPADVRVWSIANHMHKVGVDMKTSVIRGGEELCLVQTPNWDFNWQRLYQYDVPIGDVFRVQDGDVVRVRCTYDNTLDNPDVAAALGEVGLDEPQDVQLGEGTLDEMCLAGVGVAIRLP
jgi:hypothetical protein